MGRARLRLLPVCSKGRLRGLFSAAFFISVSPAWSLDCSAPSWEAHAGAVRSHWAENSTQGKSLVRERGTLTRAGLTANLSCDRWQWQLALARSEGQRTYDGVSTTNFPIQTHSDLAITDASILGWTPIAARWAGGLRLNHRTIHRDIASTGRVRGYPEQFAYWQAATGLRYERPLGPDLVLSAEGWLGGGGGGSLSLNLPNADKAQLRLGNSRLAEVALQISSPARAPAGRGWAWHVRTAYQWQGIAAGPATALMRNGVPVGSALQPETLQRALGLDIGVGYHF